MDGQHEKHAVGFTHHRQSLEESENLHLTKGTSEWRPNVSASCASHRDMTKRIKFAHQGAKPQRTDEHHARMHARTLPKRYVIDVFYGQVHRKDKAIRNLVHVFRKITLTCKLISCCNLGPFFDSKYCWFILASITRDSDEFPLMHAEKFLHAQNNNADDINKLKKKVQN